MTALASASAPEITVHNGQPATTSLEIARIFGRQHKNVTQAISRIDCSDEFARLNFQPGTYRHPASGEQTMFWITRDGFTFLAMGFTGAKAAQFKEAYIAAFNLMEATLIGPRPGQVEAVRMARVAEVLGDELLRQVPERRKLIRYRKLGLSVREIRQLMNWGEARVRKDLHLLEACNLIEVTPAVQRMRHRAITSLHPALR